MPYSSLTLEKGIIVFQGCHNELQKWSHLKIEIYSLTVLQARGLISSVGRNILFLNTLREESFLASSYLPVVANNSWLSLAL
jgi:hypothetical protein